MDTNKTDGQHEVMSPWADADPVLLRGLTAPRITDLAGKKIGLLCNTKRASRPILTVVESKLKERYPTADISWYFTQYAIGPEEIETENREKFEEWLKGVNTVVMGVGD